MKRESVWDGDKDQKNHIVLSKCRDFKKQYDEISHPHLHNISERKFCFGRHKWKNAYLSWMKGNYEVEVGRNLKPGDYQVNFAPGGLIRFCVKCKLVDCIHYLGKYEDYKVYEVRNGKYTGFIVVRKCKICGLRIMVWDASALTHNTSEGLLQAAAPLR